MIKDRVRVRYKIRVRFWVRVRVHTAPKRNGDCLPGPSLAPQCRNTHKHPLTHTM